MFYFHPKTARLRLRSTLKAVDLFKILILFNFLKKFAFDVA